MSYLPNNREFRDPTVFDVRDFAVQRTDINKKIINNRIPLEEKPDIIHHVQISGYTEIFDNSVPTENQFKCDYTNDYLTFNPLKEGVVIPSISYWGLGNILISADKVYLHNDNPDATITLQDMIDDGEQALVAMGGLESVISSATLHEASLEADIVTATSKESSLEADIATATTKKSDLDGSISTATTTKANLDGSNTTALVTKSALDASNTTANTTKTNLDNSNTTALATKTALDLSNTTANNTKTNLDSSILAGDASKTNLDASVILGNTSKSNLDLSISTSITKKADLDSSISTATTKKSDLDASISNANNSKTALDISKANADNSKTALDLSIGTGNALKTNLDSNISTGTTLNTNLGNSISGGNTTKTNLDGSISTATTLNGTLDGTIVTANTSISELNTTNDSFIVWEAYNSTHTYYPLNKVSWNGSSYICLSTCTNILPSNNSYFMLICAKGVDGTGAVMNINSTNSDIAVGNPTGEVLLTLNSGTGAYQIVKLDSNGKIPLAVIPDIAKQQTYVVTDLTARNALTGLVSGDTCYLTSNGDSYIYNGSTWVLMADADWANISLDWTNIVGRPTSSVANIDDAVTKKHSHVNQTILDNTTASFLTADETKLDGISTGANKTESSSTNGNIKVDGIEKTVYTHPSTHSADIIVDGTTNKTYTATEKTKLNSIVIATQEEAESSTSNTTFMTPLRTTQLIENPIYTAEATTTQQVTSLPSTAMKSPFAAAELEGNTNTNIVTNSNFADGTTGWTPQFSTLSTINNILSVTGNGINSAASTYQNTNIDCVEGKKVFARVKLSVTNSNSTLIDLRLLGSLGGTIQIAQQTTPTINQVYELFGIATLTSFNLGKVQIRPVQFYADATTATGKVMEVQEVLAIDMGADSTNPLYNLTADQMNARFANWFDSTKSVGMQRVKSVGKNLFDVNSYNTKSSTGIKVITVDEIAFTTTGNASGSLYFKIYSGLSDYNTVVSTSDYYSSAGNKTVTTTTTNETFYRLVFGINGNAQDAKLYYRLKLKPNTTYKATLNISSFSANSIIVDNTIQIEESSTVTYATRVYEPYTESTAYTTPELRRVGTVADTVDLLSGRHTKYISDWHSLQASDITTLGTTRTNVDTLIVALPLAKAAITGATQNVFKVPNFNASTLSTIIDDIQYIGQYVYSASINANLVLVIAKGTYASLAAAQTALAGTQILYQLATPTTTNYLPSTLISEPNGTIYTEPSITDVGYYGTNIAVADTDYPISSLDWINKIDVDTGAFIPVDIATCTVASGGLSFTISTATVDECYEYAYNYSTALSVIPSLAYSYSTNLKAQVNETVSAVERLDRKIEEKSANLKIATEAEAEAGTSNTVFMTPLRTTQLIENATYTAEATTTQQVTSLPSTAMKSPFASAELEGNTNTNIVTNSNFTSTAGWTLTVGATVSAANNVLNLTGSGSSSSPQTYQQSIIPVVTGKKMYITGRARVTNANCQYLYIKISDGTGTTITGSPAVVAAPVPNTWYTFSAIATCQASLSGNFRVYLMHTYVDAATASGKVMEVKEVMAIDMGVDSTNPLYNLTADQMNARFANWFDTTKSIAPQRVKSVGKNLFDKNDILIYGKRLSGTANGATTTDVTYNVTGYMRVNPSSTYCKTNFASTVAFYDKSKIFISEVYTNPFTVPANAIYAISSVLVANLDTAQLELGSSATTYEPYTESTAYTTPELRRVGTVADTVDLLTGKYAKNISDWYSLQASDITALITTGVNADYIQTNVSFLPLAKPSNGTVQNIIKVGNYPETTIALFDSADSHWKFVYSETERIVIIFPKGTYASLAAAQAALAGTQILYQLAVPTTANYLPSNLTSKPSGTLYLEPSITDVGYYGANIAIADTDYPIATLDFMNKIDVGNGTFTLVDITACTVASGGLSFTISGATAGEYYEYGYNYSTELSVIPSLSYSYSTNLKAQVNETVSAVERLEEALDELFTSASNGKTAIASAIAGMGQSASGSDTFLQLATKIADISDDANAVASHVLAGETFYQGGSKKTGNMISKIGSATVITPSTVDQAIAQGYYGGLAADGKVLGDVDLVTGNIRAGVNIFGVAGKSSVVETSDGDAVASNILNGKKAYVNGSLITGNVPSKTGDTGSLPSSNIGGAWDGALVLGTPNGLYNGEWHIQIIDNLWASNIKAGVKVGNVAGLGIVGTCEPKEVTAGDITMFSYAPSNTAYGTSYSRVRGATVHIKGSYRVKFDLSSQNAGATAYGRIYINNTPVGTERSTTSTDYTNYVEDIINVNPGDIIGIWGRVVGSTGARVQNFVLAAAQSIVPVYTN